MTEAAANMICLTAMAIDLALAAWKGIALWRYPTESLSLLIMTLCFVISSALYLIAAPVGFHAVGSATGRPGIGILLVDVLLIVGLAVAHPLTLLWDPNRQQNPQALRRTITAWSAMYGAATASLIVLFALADISGPSRPLAYDVASGREPAVLLYFLVYFCAAASGTLGIRRQCRAITLDDGSLRHALRGFAASMLYVFIGYVGCGLPVVIANALGYQGLD